jgi:hypothetical protein
MCDNGKTLTLKVEKLWNGDQKDEIKKNLDGWLIACKKGKDKISKAKKQFHQWHPLRVYVSVGKAKSNTAVFSLRFFGQEVAELVVETNNEVKLRLSKNHSEKNHEYFKNLTLKQDEYSWNGEEAKMFRKFFKDLAANSGEKPKVRSDEHRIESKFIEEMLKGRGKFSRPDLEIQPITLGGCPLQFPVPFSANTGRPVAKTGHIDILARRKAEDNKTRLSVWELKKQGAYKQAASQAYIYATQLLRILRSDKGNEWYNLFGFSGTIPKSLEIEAVVAITDDQRKRFDSEKEKFWKNEINGDIIKLYAVYYREESNNILLGEDSFQEN